MNMEPEKKKCKGVALSKPPLLDSQYFSIYLKISGGYEYMPKKSGGSFGICFFPSKVGDVQVPFLIVFLVILPTLALPVVKLHKNGWLCCRWRHRATRDPVDPTISTAKRFGDENHPNNHRSLQELPLKFNIAPQKLWLEDYFPIGKVTFQGLR